MQKNSGEVNQVFVSKLVISRSVFRLLNSRGVFFENPKWKERMGITGPSLKWETGYMIIHKRKNDLYRPD